MMQGALGHAAGAHVAHQLAQRIIGGRAEGGAAAEQPLGQPHARERRLGIEPDGDVHQLFFFERALRNGQLAQHVGNAAVLQVIEAKA